MNPPNPNVGVEHDHLLLGCLPVALGYRLERVEILHRLSTQGAAILYGCRGGTRNNHYIDGIALVKWQISEDNDAAFGAGGFKMERLHGATLNDRAVQGKWAASPNSLLIYLGSFTS